jgi:DNA primase
MKRMILCAQANEIDLVNYLQNAGQRPLKIRGNEYWYLSPLREEKTPSFKVDRKQNIWYDHGIGKGGNFVDFGILFHNCSVKEFLQNLEEKKSLFFTIVRQK